MATIKDKNHLEAKDNMTMLDENTPEKISANEALERVNKRYARMGVKFTVGMIYQKARREELSTIKVNNQLFFDPEEIDRARFRISKTKLPDGMSLHKIKSFWDLKQLRKKWGELLDTEGLIDAIENITRERYGVGIRYSHAAIKRKRLDKTLLCVGYQGVGNNRQYWFPAFQLELINLDPTKKEMNPYLQKRKQEELEGQEEQDDEGA